MDDTNVGALNDDSLGVSGTASSKPGALGYLSGEWVNTRMMNVADRCEGILNKIIDKGLLSGNFAPFESPVTDDMLVRMTPPQFEALYTTLPSEEEKAALLERMKALKMPTSQILPKAPQPMHPTGMRFGRVVEAPSGAVNSGSSV